MGDLEDLKEILKKTRKECILFGEGFDYKLKLRPYLSKKCLLDFTQNKLDKLVEVRLQDRSKNKLKYKATFDLDKNHDLIVIYKVFKEKIIIVTAYKTNRKCQKKLERMLQKV